MNCCNNSISQKCSCLAFVISLIVGIAFALLYYFRFIYIGMAVLATILLLAGLLLIFLFLSALLLSVFHSPVLKKCFCNNAVCLLVGILGTILAVLIAQLIYLYPITIFAAVIVALLGFFFTLMLISFIVFIFCIKSKSCTVCKE